MFSVADLRKTELLQLTKFKNNYLTCFLQNSTHNIKQHLSVKKMHHAIYSVDLKYQKYQPQQAFK